MGSEETASDGGFFAGKMIVIIVVVILIAAAGAGAYFFLLNGEDTDDDVDDDENGDGNGNGDENGNGSTPSSDLEAGFFFWGNLTGTEGFVLVDEKVTFDGSGSKGAVHYSWDFGDEHNAYGEPVVTHYYRDPGTYTVILNVTDGYETDFETQDITVVQMPNVTLQARRPTDTIMNHTGVEWFIGVTASGNDIVMLQTYFYITLTRNNETYFNSSVLDLEPAPGRTTLGWDDGVYYEDTTSSGTISTLDEFSIAGKGVETDSIDSVKAGDIFSIYFSITGDLLDSTTLPE